MTETEWTGDHEPYRLLACLKDGSPRKFRLLTVAPARRVLPERADSELVGAIETSERFADWEASRGDLASARNAMCLNHPQRVGDWYPLYGEKIETIPAWHTVRTTTSRRTVLQCFTSCISGIEYTRSGMRGVGRGLPWSEIVAQTRLIRDIFENPFRPVAFDPRWRTSDVVDVARGIYEDKVFERMPILADALMDAGCEDEQIIGHCRGDGLHVRGCWVVDLLLNKE